MRLADVFAAFGDLVDGSRGHAEVAAQLYTDPSSPDAQRLAVYEGNVRHSRRTILERYYPLTREAALRAGGERAWTTVVDGYFRAHPPHGYRYLECAKALPDFLRDAPEATSLPPWVAELADVELWQTLTRVDAREDERPDAGPLRLGLTVELRDYRFAITKWLAGGAGLPPGEPQERPHWVLFFRDRDGASRRAVVGPAEVAVLAAIDAARPLADGDAQAARALESLAAAGVILGAGFGRFGDKAPRSRALHGAITDP